MMGKGADGGCTVTGCGANCNAGFGRLPKCPVQCNGLGKAARRRGQLRRGVDGYSQVLKALAVKLTHGGEDANASSLVNALSYNKRKNKVKKTDYGCHTDQLENSWNRDSGGVQFWVQMEEFFRELVPEDIQVLLPVTKLPCSGIDNSLDPLLVLPPVGCFYEDMPKQEDAIQRVEAIKAVEAGELTQMQPLVSCCYDEDAKDATIDKFFAPADLAVLLKRKQRPAANSANKKRKLMAPVTDTMVTIISPVNDDDEELCDVCYGDESSEQNQILFCDSCNVAVHQDCYGIERVPDGQWLCSWCSHRVHTCKEEVQNRPAECALCPSKGGAVKWVDSNKFASKVALKPAFGHLFCCQWIPETFIGDVKKMEPIMNVEGIREERWKLVCSICKDKYGACIQCSHGLCATAFHPLCARQARLRMEVSSREGTEEIDLRAFCLKHTAQFCKTLSSLHEGIEVEHGTFETEDTRVTPVDNTPIEADDGLGLESSSGDVLRGVSNGAAERGVSISKDDLDTVNVGAEERHIVRNVLECSHSSTADIAIEMGIPHDSLCNWLEGVDLQDVGLQSKIKSWILTFGPSTSNMHGYSPAKNISSREQQELTKFNDALKLSGVKRRKVEQSASSSIFNRFKAHEDLFHTAKSNNEKCTEDAPMERQRAFKEHEAINTEEKSERIVDGRGQGFIAPSNGLLCDSEKDRENRKSCLLEEKEEEQVEDSCSLQRGAIDRSNVKYRNLGINVMNRAPLPPSVLSEGCQTLAMDHWRASGVSVPVNEGVDFRLRTVSSCLNVHPFIMERLQKVHSSRVERCSETERDDQDRFSETPGLSLASGVSNVQERSGSKIYQADRTGLTLPQAVKPTSDLFTGSIESQLKQLEHARELGVFNTAPRDEMEEEVLSLQLRLVACAENNLQQCENLILRVITNLADDHRASRRKAKDMALVNEYLAALREAKKQGRKERRNKEAQAVLAAAAALAASPRVGTLKKDTFASHLREERQNVMDICSPSAQGNLLLYGPTDMPKPTKLNTGAGRTSSASRISSHDKANLFGQLDGSISTTVKSQGSPSEIQVDLTICDVCKRPSHLNTIIVCARCKVAVHQECYGVNRALESDWYCQPCSEIVRQFQGSSVPAITEPSAPGCGVVCALCFGISGAFKRYCGNDWAHAFCAQWVPEAAYKKEETGLIEGLKLVPVEKFSQECSACHRSLGVRLRCSFGHCHGSFHPLCARDAGFFMNIKCGTGGRVHYRAYCERHSPQQRQKAESRKCGSTDELTALMQMRVELERVRIICERISRRERIKRDRMMCMKSLYVARMSSLPFSVMASNNLSTTSNSLDTHEVFYKDSSWVTSNQQYGSLPVKPQGMESESYSWNSAAGEVNRCQDSMSGESVQQTQLSSSDPSRQTSARSRTPYVSDVCGERISGWADGSLKPDERKKPKRQQKADPLHTEVIMTPTEASVQNQRLPKGYAYVPVGLFTKGKVDPLESSVPKDL